MSPDTEKLDKLMNERMSSGEMASPEGLGSVLVLDHKDAESASSSRFRQPRDARSRGGRFGQQGDTIPEEIRGKPTSVHYYDVVIYDGDVEAAKARGDSMPKVRAINGRVSMITLRDSGDSIRASAQEADQPRRRTPTSATRRSRTSRSTTSRCADRRGRDPELDRA